MAVPDSLNSLRIPDFNGDGRTDLFGFNANARTPEITLLAGVRPLGSSSFSFTLDDWQDPKVGDFNGDCKTDLIWRNDKLGLNAIWLMNGTMIQSAAFLEPLQGDWSEVVGDFNGNGKSDLLWYNPKTGDYQVWLMEGLQRVKQTSGKIQQGWQAAIADFDNDNRSDIFWRNPTTGDNGVWTFDPQTLAIRGEFIPSKAPTWTPEIIDFNGDGLSDIFWRDRLTGQNQVWTWTVSGLQPDPTPIELPSVSSDFMIKTADFKGTGRTDFLVRNPSAGEDQVWLSEDTGVQVLPFATQSAGFQAVIGDYNGDRFSDIRWISTPGTQGIIWFSDGILPRAVVT